MVGGTLRVVASCAAHCRAVVPKGDPSAPTATPGCAVRLDISPSFLFRCRVRRDAMLATLDVWPYEVGRHRSPTGVAIVHPRFPSCLRHDHADGNLPEVRGVVGVHRLVARVESHFAADIAAQLVSRPVTLTVSSVDIPAAKRVSDRAGIFRVTVPRCKLTPTYSGWRD